MAEKEYIEREAIINKIVNTPTVPTRQCYEGNFVYADGVSGRQNEIINYINEQPTADVAPVRHGRWIAEYDCGYITPHCSECGETALTKEETSYDYVYSSYCHNCGARMDGDADANGNDNKTPET